MKIRSIPLFIVIVVLTAGAGAALLFTYGRLGPKTIPPTERVGVELREYEVFESVLLDMQRAVLTLSRCPPQPSQDEEARGLLRAAYGESAPAIWSLFYNDGLDSPSPDSVYTQEGFFLPLLYHRGIEITEIYRVIGDTGEDFVIGETVIREEYTGSDPLLRGFWRESVLRMDEDGHWVFVRLEGQLAVEHPELFSTYLPLKEEYQWV